jgi:signal transduction histidine kinase
LRNALTLMPRSAGSSPHLRQLRDSSDEIERTLASLLTLARAESAVLESMKLRPLLETLLLERSRILDSRGFDLEVDVPDATEVQGNLQLTKLLLANLLDNALHYAEPPRLDINLLHDRLVLENPVRDEFTPPHGESLKHGLALSRRLADAQKCQLEIETSQGLFRATVGWRR